MTLKVKVISKEIIRPSNATPSHLKTCKLSLLDQYSPTVHFPVIFFYSDMKNVTQLDHLKNSLSGALTEFYPLAGRINGNQFIDCNDEGVNLIETQVSGPLSHVVAHPEADHLSHLLPPVDNMEALLSIQANQFACGGLAIAMSMSHKVGDASSLCLFVNHWAALSRGDRNAVSVSPDFNTAYLFPPQDDLPSLPGITLQTQNLVSKRFVFDSRNISALKAKISDNPTRVEAVSALVWWCAIRTGAVNSQSVMGIAVNFRGRMVPPLSKLLFGNLVLCTLARTNTETHSELPSLAVQLREAIRRVHGNYAGQLKIPERFGAYSHHLLEVYKQYLGGELGFYTLSSWCRFPFYEADFGCGKPVWVSYAYSSRKNVTVLMDTKCGQGVEAWVTLDEEDMVKCQSDPELSAFTSTGSTMI